MVYHPQETTWYQSGGFLSSGNLPLERHIFIRKISAESPIIFFPGYTHGKKVLVLIFVIFLIRPSIFDVIVNSYGTKEE